MKPAEHDKKSIIFLCSYNSVRSQMAEGLMRHLFGDRYNVYSAGIAIGRVNPYAIAVMKEAGIDISHQRSKTLHEFKGWHFDVVVTLCDHGKEACVYCLPKGDLVLHHNFPVPNEIGLPEEEIMKEFSDVRDQIQSWLMHQFG